MDYLEDYTLQEQTPKEQFEILQQFEKDEEVTVFLEEKGSTSGTITNASVNGPQDNPEEVYIQFLDYKRNFRHDDMGHQTVSISRTEDSQWNRAELTYSWTDSGRVRKKSVDKVERVWPDLTQLQHSTVLSYEEAQVVSLKEAGLTKQEMADQWGCEETKVEAVLGSIRGKYDKAKETLHRLESSPVDLDENRFPSLDFESGKGDWNSDQQEKSNRKADSESE